MYNNVQVVKIVFVGGTHVERGEKMFIDPEVTAVFSPYDMDDVSVPHQKGGGSTKPLSNLDMSEAEVYCMQIFMKLLRSLPTAR